MKTNNPVFIITAVLLMAIIVNGCSGSDNEARAKKPKPAKEQIKNNKEI